MSSIPSRAAAWAVHAFTASGAVMGLAALQATAAGDYRAAFLWMIAATAVDGVDGWLARLARVGELAPSVDGGRLDDIVDYLTYVVAPAFLVVRSGLLPELLGWPAAAAMLLSSAYQFCRTDSKTPDHYFTGFPSYWNIVALYLYVLGLGSGGERRGADPARRARVRPDQVCLPVADRALAAADRRARNDLGRADDRHRLEAAGRAAPRRLRSR